MKNLFIKMLITATACLSFVSASFAADTYSLDPSHSYVIWHVSHFGFSNYAGKWSAEGTLVIDEEHPKNSKVNATIHVNNMITGDPNLDEHLRGKLFFDTTQFPVATFVSDKVDMTGKTSAKVHGMLTVRGVTKPVVLTVSLNKIGTGPITDKKTVGFTAETKLKRSEFGIDTLLPGLGDDVDINIQTEAIKTS